MEGPQGEDDEPRPAPWLKEGGESTMPIAFHFQLRPNPLADDANPRLTTKNRERRKSAPRPIARSY
jgi:hypothetical protein